MNLSKYAINAFLGGSDNYGETVIGTTGVLEYCITMDQYHMTVLLDDAGHSCTSGIGFDVVDDQLRVTSGHTLRWSIPITDEIQQELDKARKEHSH